MRALGQLALRFTVAAAIVGASVPAWAHPEDEVTPENVLRAWSWEPVVVAALAITAFLFAFGVLRLWRRARPERTFAVWRVAVFAAGWLTLVLALVSPLHRLGSELFLVHMTQHELLMLIAAPLLVLGRPLVPFLWALPMLWRERAGALAKLPRVSRSWNAITAPVAAWVVHGLTLWVWHAPALYQATLESEWIHGLQHTMFLASALLFWWTLVHGRYGRLGYGMALLYVFTTAVHSSVLGALITFSQRLWYPIYEGRTLAWHLTALEDQQVGGLIMWIPAGTVLIGVALAFLAAWLRDSERRGTFTTAAAIARAGDRNA
jgi:putative membrane protein